VVLAVAAATAATINLLPYIPIVTNGLQYLGFGWLASLSWALAVVLFAGLQVLESMPFLPFIHLSNLDRLYKRANRTKFDLPAEGDNRPVVRLQLYKKLRRRTSNQLALLSGVALVAYGLDLYMVMNQFPWFDGPKFVLPNMLLTFAIVLGFQLFALLASTLKELVPDLFGDGLTLGPRQVVDAEVVNDDRP
jgi:hypothetical protein